MKRGYLSEYFSGVAVKILSAVEADPGRSHQHEFNGDDGLKQIFGLAAGKQTFFARFIYINDFDDEPVMSDGFLTWYDARERHPTRSEYRLYFPTTPVSMCAAEGDLLVIGRRQDGSALVVIAEGGSTVANQIRWLFGFSDMVHPGFSVKAETESDQVKLEFASRLILDEIGVEQAEEEEIPNYLDLMLARFSTFPTTREFSVFARETLSGLDPRDDPDAVLLAWKDRWMQILAEADRIEEKHLLTLEPGISVNQTDEMRDKRLALVVPANLHSSYTALQRTRLLTFSDFIALAGCRQAS